MSNNSEYRFDTFNARYLSLEEVAGTFIANKAYQELIQNNHSLLMGPRGCGKTTLLKMVTPRAVFHYNTKYEEGDKINIPFIGVYIPADKQWERQLQSFSSRFSKNENFSVLVSKQIVNTNIFISLINTFYDLSSLCFQQGAESFIKEGELCKELIEVFKLNKPISASYASILGALKIRISDINSMINQVEWGYKKVDNIDFPDYFFFNFLDIVDTCTLKFEQIYKDDINNNQLPSRWALCFDELEIAPTWLQEILIKDHLRSTVQKFLFKLTTTPLVDTKYWLEESADTNRPSQNEDYKIIRNWIFDRSTEAEWKKFSETLLTSLFARTFEISINPDKLFGKTVLNMNQAITSDPETSRREGEKKLYSEGSVEWEVFRSLAKSDPTFYTFLDRKGIKPYNPYPTSSDLADSIFRKIKPIAYHRYYFKKDNRFRSRKTIDLYSGTPLIYEICDGNPRTLLNLFDNFKSFIKLKAGGKVPTITISDQARAIQNISKAKLDNIKNHPDANIVLDNNKKLNLGDLLAQIADYFFNAMMNQKFTMDPIGTFVIDRNTDRKIASLLKVGLNLGAIQYINPKQDLTNEDIYDKTYRISFVLYPSFRLPIREYNSISLSTILQSKIKTISNNQQELFNDEH